MQGQTDQNSNLSSDFNTSGLGGDFSVVSLSEPNSSDSVSATNPSTSSSASSATGVIEPDEEDVVEEKQVDETSDELVLDLDSTIEIEE